MVQGQIFLKGGGGAGAVFIFRNYFNLCKIVLCIWKKKNFSATILGKKVILSCLNMNLKTSHKL